MHALTAAAAAAATAAVPGRPWPWLEHVDLTSLSLGEQRSYPRFDGHSARAALGAVQNRSSAWIAIPSNSEKVRVLFLVSTCTGGHRTEGAAPLNSFFPL